MANKPKTGSLSYNRKASFNIDIEEKWEAGLILSGDEIKSIRAGRVQLVGGFVRIFNNEPVVVGMHLSLAAQPERVRNLLLSAKEITDLKNLLQVQGKVAVPLDVHLRHGWAKLTIGIGKGRKQFDKRELLKKRDLERENQRS